MKLKKIASLALAGVMAVSMLAGCATGTGNSDNNGATVGTGASSSAASVFNDSQNAGNDVKVSFSTSAALDAALTRAVKAYPQHDAGTIASSIYAYTGIKTTASIKDALNDEDVADGDSVTYLVVEQLGKGDVWSEDAAVQMVANSLDNEIAGLNKDNYQKGQTKDSYLAYSYTGNVSVVTSETADGAVCYYIAYTVTKSAAKANLTEQDA